MWVIVNIWVVFPRPTSRMCVLVCISDQVRHLPVTEEEAVATSMAPKPGSPGWNPTPVNHLKLLNLFVP